MTGGTDCWNRDDAYNSVPSPPRQTERKKIDIYKENEIRDHTVWKSRDITGQNRSAIS